jgi:hypothetical protein
MSGGMSTDVNAPLWSNGSGGVSSYSADGRLSSSHGRNSALYRQQNNTLYSSFGEENVGLTDLTEDADESDEEHTIRGTKKDERMHNDVDSVRR